MESGDFQRPIGWGKCFWLAVKDDAKGWNRLKKMIRRYGEI
jgi:hypothetical protein